MLKLYRNHQGKIILAALVLAFALGIAFPHLFKPLEFISSTFINLLKLCALPIVLTSLIVTIGGLQQLHELKKVARNSVIYIILTEMVAVTIGLVVFNLVDISGNINASSLLSGAHYSQSTSTAIDTSHIFNYIFSIFGEF
jgi:Na+/H+-dicarboxylate symporter